MLDRDFDAGNSPQVRLVRIHELGHALGSAVAAAVTAGAAAGGYDDWQVAQDRMTSVTLERYEPRPDAVAVYTRLYALYRELHDTFGGVPGTTANIPTMMKRLLALRHETMAS